MNKRQQLKKIIGKLTCPNLKEFDCTIGRVMQALKNKGLGGKIDIDGNFDIITGIDYETATTVYNKFITIRWKLTKKNGEECEDDDQSDETIEKLYDLIK